MLRNLNKSYGSTVKQSVASVEYQTWISTLDTENTNGLSTHSKCAGSWGRCRSVKLTKVKIAAVVVLVVDHDRYYEGDDSVWGKMTKKMQTKKNRLRKILKDKESLSSPPHHQNQDHDHPWGRMMTTRSTL